ncbi:MAG TPA: response regulator [Ohtaekwangia sp.]|uniref:response regulator n=1 Tax=Ohtaekwangia sp. TaxID=2066019 RepID=UPI002F927B24
MSKKVLIVDDSRYMRMLIQEALEQSGYTVVGQASTGEQAIDMAFDLQPDIVTLDNILPDMIGLDILKAYQAGNLASSVVIISAVGQESVIQEGLTLGARGYIVKPFTQEQLLQTIQAL